MKFENYIIKQELEVFNTEIENCSVEKTLYKVMKASITDELTGCLNRVKIPEIVDYFQDEYVSRKMGVALIDIDHFKQINDNYGHACGDYVLKKLSSELREFYCEFFSVEQPLMMRWGGEEFLFFFPVLENCNAGHFGKLLKSRVAQIDFKYRGQKLYVKVSGGIDFYDVSERIDEAIERADQALYYSKNCGRDLISEYSDIKLEFPVSEVISPKIVKVTREYPLEIDATDRFELFDRARKNNQSSMMGKGFGRLLQVLDEEDSMLFELTEFDNRWDLNPGDYFTPNPECDFRKHFLYEKLEPYFNTDIALLYHTGDCRIFSPGIENITGVYYFKTGKIDDVEYFQREGLHYFIFEAFSESDLFYFISATRYGLSKLFDVKGLNDKNREDLLRLLYQRQDWDFLDAGIELYEESICVDFFKGLLAALSGNFQKAFDLLDSLEPSDEVLGNKAGCLIRLGLLDQADKVLNDALKIAEPEWCPQLREHLFYLYFKKNDLQGMLNILDELTDPLQRAKAMLNISDYYLESGDDEQMEKYLSKAKELDPFLIDLVFNTK